MDEDSFDPRSWGRTQAPGDKPPAPERSGEAESGKSALPEAWREVAQAAGAAVPPGDKDPAPKTAAAKEPATGQARGLPRFVLPALSVALLLAGAGGAWLTRQAPVVEGQPVAEGTGEAAGPQLVTRTLNLASVPELEAALTASGVSAADAHAAALAAAPVLRQQAEIRAVIDLLPNGAGFILQRLQASYKDGSGAIVDRTPEGTYGGTAVAANLTRQVKVLRGEIDSTSFYSSAVAAGLLDTLVPEFINAFAYDFNIASEVNPGDTFEVSYEQNVNPQGEPVGQPELLFASLTTPTKSLALYRYKSADGTVAWYDGNGAITQRGFMRTPVDGARITSNFGMRFHPVLHYTRLHAGVDFGVPVGTPVYAAAAGVVTGATPTGCGGNMAVVTHDNGWVTRYFHLSKYADGLHEGQRVPQGFTLGLSGTTGTCTTGPHLHYELRINGEPVDPLSVKTDDSTRKVLSGTEHTAFIALRNRIDVARADQSR